MPGPPSGPLRKVRAATDLQHSHVVPGEVLGSVSYLSPRAQTNLWMRHRSPTSPFGPLRKVRAATDGSNPVTSSPEKDSVLSSAKSPCGLIRKVQANGRRQKPTPR